jgi:hypothetical protein
LHPPAQWLGTPSDFVTFIPEGVIALAVVAASPFWLVWLVAHGKYSAALILVAGVAAATWLGVFAYRHREKSLLYVAIVVALITALGVNMESK